MDASWQVIQDSVVPRRRGSVTKRVIRVAMIGVMSCARREENELTRYVV